MVNQDHTCPITRKWLQLLAVEFRHGRIAVLVSPMHPNEGVKDDQVRLSLIDKETKSVLARFVVEIDALAETVLDFRLPN